MCLYPRLMKNKKYVATKKNGGVVPVASDNRMLYVPVGCGKCMECRRQKANGWRTRLMEEIREGKKAEFVTLSFSDESLYNIENGIGLDGKKNKIKIKGLEGYELENEIATRAVRMFTERWRKKYKKSVRHWLVTELGQTETERIHIHGILWTEEREQIEKLWQYGNVYLGNVVNEVTVNYIVKYLSKTDGKHPNYNAKMYVSNGLGRNYVNRVDAKGNKYKKGGTNETYRTRQGLKIGLPVYYRNKIYSEEEREKLWIEKLDEEVRWVNGVPIDISEGEEIYERALAEAQSKNERLGFGNDEIDWDKRKYERNRRNLLKLERIERLRSKGSVRKKGRKEGDN